MVPNRLVWNAIVRPASNGGAPEAIIIAMIFEFLGAYFAGGEVTSTIRKGIIDAQVMNDNPELMVYGMLSALLAAGTWLFIASIRGWPVSTTHSIVGALVGFAAASGTLGAPGLILYAGLVFWTLGYDTIYACQDKEDDALVGVKSTARLFGAHAPLWVAAFYAVCAIAAAAAGYAAGLSWIAALAALPFAAHLGWQAARFRPDDGALCLGLFKSNREAGLLLAAGYASVQLFLLA